MPGSGERWKRRKPLLPDVIAIRDILWEYQDTQFRGTSLAKPKSHFTITAQAIYDAVVLPKLHDPFKPAPMHIKQEEEL